MKKVLVIGDLILDEYLYVESKRFAQEASVPIFDVVKRDVRFGGAANVWANIASIGDGLIKVDLLGIKNPEWYAPREFVDSEIFTKKTRVVLDGKIVARIDHSDEPNRLDLLDEMIDIICYRIHKYDAIVISDYKKGLLDEENMMKIMHETRDHDVSVFVDSKAMDLSPYEGAEFLSINENEYSTQVSNKSYRNVESLFGSVVVTMGVKGALLRRHVANDRNAYAVSVTHIPTTQVQEVDVTGCGDVHLAAFVVAKMNGMVDDDAVHYANKAAGVAVTRFGTTVVKRWDFLTDSDC